MKDVERTTACCHRETYGTALPAKANVNFRAPTESLSFFTKQKSHFKRTLRNTQVQIQAWTSQSQKTQMDMGKYMDTHRQGQTQNRACTHTQ